jgi:hypothetical protein
LKALWARLTKIAVRSNWITSFFSNNVFIQHLRRGCCLQHFRTSKRLMIALIGAAMQNVE